MTTPSTSGRGLSDPRLSVITSERRQLVNVAYRLLGSLSDTEDVVQEACTRWYSMSPQQQEAADSPGAWLTTVVSRICLDQLREAGMTDVSHEVYADHRAVRFARNPGGEAGSLEPGARPGVGREGPGLG